MRKQYTTWLNKVRNLARLAESYYWEGKETRYEATKLKIYDLIDQYPVFVRLAEKQGYYFN